MKIVREKHSVFFYYPLIEYNSIDFWRDSNTIAKRFCISLIAFSLRLRTCNIRHQFGIRASLHASNKKWNFLRHGYHPKQKQSPQPNQPNTDQFQSYQPQPEHPKPTQSRHKQFQFQPPKSNKPPEHKQPRT